MKVLSILILFLSTPSVFAANTSPIRAGTYQLTDEKALEPTCTKTLTVTIDDLGIHLSGNDYGESFLYADSGCKKLEGDGPSSKECTEFSKKYVRTYESTWDAVGFMKLETRVTQNEDSITYTRSVLMVPIGILLPNVDITCTYQPL